MAVSDAVAGVAQARAAPSGLANEASLARAAAGDRWRTSARNAVLTTHQRRVRVVRDGGQDMTSPRAARFRAVIRRNLVAAASGPSCGVAHRHGRRLRGGSAALGCAVVLGSDALVRTCDVSARYRPAAALLFSLCLEDGHVRADRRVPVRLMNLLHFYRRRRCAYGTLAPSRPPVRTSIGPLAFSGLPGDAPRRDRPTTHRITPPTREGKLELPDTH
ncbi:hypothetical protein C2E23DRAFT_387618 [Lenzites betulinus]|nr:hypothetical protein C2E23DRAFT_387618 [Lenzites betulinus]